MLFICQSIRHALLGALSAGLVALWPSDALALGLSATPAALADGLPNLHSTIPPPGYFHLGAESAGFSYNSRFEKWNAKVDGYTSLDPALTMDYGLQLTNRFGAGALLTHEADYSEVVLNGIYAPKRNLRFRVAGAQLRTSGSLLSSDPSNTFLQNSYLFGAKKYWDKYEHLSSIGISAYSVGTNASTAAHAFSPAGDEPLETASTLARGRLDGYQLNLSVRPSPQSKLELRREANHLTYYYGAGAQRQDPLVSSQVSYTRRIGNCTRLQGGYSTSTDADRVDIRLSKNNWNVRLSRELAYGDSDSAVHLGYVIPLGKSSRKSWGCGSGAEGAPAFEPVADAAKQRPQQFPRSPLVITGVP